MHQPKDIDRLGNENMFMHVLPLTTSLYLTPQIVSRCSIVRLIMFPLWLEIVIIFFFLVWLFIVKTDKHLLVLWKNKRFSAKEKRTVYITCIIKNILLLQKKEYNTDFIIPLLLLPQHVNCTQFCLILKASKPQPNIYCQP